LEIFYHLQGVDHGVLFKDYQAIFFLPSLQHPSGYIERVGGGLAFPAFPYRKRRA